jgi:CMP/dCMP kinase
MSPMVADVLDRLKPVAALIQEKAAALWPKVAGSPLLLAVPVLVALMIFAGYEVMCRDGERFRRVSRLWFRLGSLLIVLGIILHFWPNVFPDLGGESVASETILNAALAALGAGAALISVSLGFRLGGLFGGEGTHLRRGRPVVIAIDGPAASGKGTLAKRIADYYRLPCLDTGLLYRAVARDVQAAGLNLEDAKAAAAAASSLNPKSLDDEALRTAAAGEAASVVAKFPEVRTALLAYQRAFATKQKRGAVLDGRDIGTVVCPEADVKIYVTATSEERAKRRHRELEARGETVAFEGVLEDIRRRDSRDIGRTIAPLWPAKDAITLDTTAMSPDQAFKAALNIIATKLRMPDRDAAP